MVLDSRTRDAICKPVNPIELFRRLTAALGVDSLDSVVRPDAIVSMEFPDVNSPNFRDLYLLKEVLRKYPGFDLGIDTQQAALSAFLEDEWLNTQTNDRLGTYNVESPRVSEALRLASRKAVGVLGRFSPDEFMSGLRFGPGATTRLSAECALTERKLSGVPFVHASASALALEVLSISPHWMWQITDNGKSEVVMKIYNFDRFEVVPKNAKTGRTIGIAPDLSIMLQLAAGYCMRSRLASAGINLSDQTVNQRMAREGSLTGRTATLDVKSASNSLTQALVYVMLGSNSAEHCDLTWYRLLDCLRVPGCLIDGKSHEYELFSAMGNGFTFELESLIFWALCSAACEVLSIPPEVSVYGDDLIVPVEVVPFLTELLGWCGFRLNADKSFSTETGPLFRESCGKHYLNGMDVTPFYVDRELNTPDQIVLLANNILRWCKLPWGRDGRLASTYYWVVSHLRGDMAKCRIPFGESDDGLIMDFDEAVPAVVHERSFKVYPIYGYTLDKTRTHTRVSEGSCIEAVVRHMIGYRVRVFTYAARSTKPNDDDGYLVWLFNKSWTKFSPPKAPKCVTLNGYGVIKVPTEAPMPYKRPKGRKRSVHFKTRIVSSQWPVIGPWLSTDGEEMTISFDLGFELARRSLSTPA